MKLAICRTAYWLVVAILVVSLTPSLLVGSLCICIGGDAELEKVCPSPRVRHGDCCVGVNSDESRSKANNPKECSNCIDIDPVHPYWSARLQRVEPGKSNPDQSPSRAEAEISKHHTYQIRVRAFKFTSARCLTLTQSQLESTVLRC